MEIKRNLSPKLEKGFYFACEEIQPQKRIVVYPGQETFPLPNDVTAMSLPDAGRLLLDL